MNDIKSIRNIIWKGKKKKKKENERNEVFYGEKDIESQK